MLKDKSVTDFTNLFLPDDLKNKKQWYNFKLFLWQTFKNGWIQFPWNTNMYPSLNDQHFRLNKTSEVRDYFIGKIKERELMSKRFSNILLPLTILVTN